MNAIRLDEDNLFFVPTISLMKFIRKRNFLSLVSLPEGRIEELIIAEKQLFFSMVVNACFLCLWWN